MDINSYTKCGCYNNISSNNNHICKICYIYYDWKLCNKEEYIYYKKIYKMVKKYPFNCINLVSDRKIELYKYLNVNLVNICFQYDLMYCMINSIY